MTGLGRLLFEEAAELAARGLEGALLLLGVAVIEQWPPFLQHIEDEFFDDRFSKRFQAIERTARRKLYQLSQAKSLRDLALPGNLLEALQRDRLGQHSMRINDQFRVCFVWRGGDAHEV